MLLIYLLVIAFEVFQALLPHGFLQAIRTLSTELHSDSNQPEIVKNRSL
jgi:hypothetical protein